jgi:autotransporter-associated beta strand protein
LRFDNGSTIRGDGGFSAYNGNATVTLVTAIGGTTPANLVWNDGKFLADGYAFLLGSIKADSRLDFTNSIGLDNGASTNPYSVREIRVADNPNSTTDIMRLSGVISGSKNSDLLKTDAGTLELTGANTYAGNTIVKGGTLVLSGSYTGGGNFTVNAGATLQINSNFTLNSSISGSGNVVLSGNSTLTGTGVITGRFTLQPGSTLAPTGFGSLTMGNATWMGGSTFVLNYNTAVTSPIPGVDNSVVKAVNGAILDLSNLSSSNRMNLQLNAIPGGSGSDSSVVYTFAQYPQILGLTPGNVSQLFNITGNYSGTPLVSYIHASSDILQVSFTPAPEPTSLLLGAALGLGLWRFRLKKGIKLN